MITILQIRMCAIVAKMITNSNEAEMSVSFTFDRIRLKITWIYNTVKTMVIADKHNQGINLRHGVVLRGFQDMRSHVKVCEYNLCEKLRIIVTLETQWGIEI